MGTKCAINYLCVESVLNNTNCVKKIPRIYKHNFIAQYYSKYTLSSSK